MSSRILRYLVLCLSLSAPYALFGGTQNSCPSFLFGMNTQPKDPEISLGQAEKLKSCLDNIESDQASKVAREIHQSPKLLEQFDKYYVDIQVECDSFLNGEQTPAYCPEMLRWTEALSVKINEQLNVNRASDSLEQLVIFSEQLDEYFNGESKESPLGETQSALKGKHINDSPRRQKTIQEVRGREKMIEACQFLKDRSWSGLQLSELKDWVKVIEKIYQSQQKEELSSEAFCFLKTYYEAVEDYDSLMVLLLEMPEGENFCSELI